MSWLAHGMFWLLCGEWLLLLRGYPSARYFCGLVAVTAFRQVVVVALLPRWEMVHALTLVLCLIALLNHVRLLVEGKWVSARRRFDFPEEGASWLILIFHNRKLAECMEVVVIGVFYFFLVTHRNAVILPPIRVYANQPPIAYARFEPFANGQCVLTGLAFLLYTGRLNVLRSRPRRAQPEQTQLGFGVVQAEKHPPLPLPSVKDLRQQLQQFYE